MPSKQESHRTVTGKMLDGAFVGVCSCGYITPDCKTREDAQQNIFNHRVTTGRKK